MLEAGSRTADGLRVRRIDGTTVAELRGEVDLLTAPALSVRLDALTSSPAPDLVVDLRAVTFLDCRGLALLCRARNRALSRGGRLRLVASDGHILRVMRLTRLARVFDVSAGLAEALTSPAPATLPVTAAVRAEAAAP
ncbi:STAS domain-containing protein [Streptomyces sp. F63]|uniref:STAS domain-containing protein n=1 Tax=Streptomyces sp. F63 TaxID=2824887 RepID=UPI001B36AFF9|nr:STAS domain-containing protein [Streptomyces sp. F63]MBQ0988208.1 STAS domain-containing protein [Streptomyces sp. F63]